MAKQASVNNLPATGAASIFDLVAFLVTHGWVVLEDSDGTTHESDVPANGRQVTGAGAGANGLANSNAWIRIREPNATVDPATGGVAREWTFQRDTINSHHWRVKVSALDGFIIGTPGPTETPQAADGNIIWGGGTDAAPVHTQMFPTDGTYRWHMVLFDVAEDTVYPFYAFSTGNGTGIPTTLIMQESFDPLSYPALVGTRAVPTSGEPDPCLYVSAYTAGSDYFEYGTGSTQWTGTNNQGRGWYAMNDSNGASEAWVRYVLNGYYGNTNSTALGSPADSILTDGFGSNPLDGLDYALPILCGRQAALLSQIGIKGFLAHLRWTCIDRGYPDIMTISGEDHLYLRHFLMPWPNGVAPLV